MIFVPHSAQENRPDTVKQIILYSRPYCGWCEEAKKYLQDRGLSFTVIDVNRDPDAQAELLRISGQQSVPTIVVNGRVLADFDVEQLKKFLDEPELP